MATLFLGTSDPAGAALLRYGFGVQQRTVPLPAGATPDGADFALDCTPYPVAPAGEGGTCVFRGVDVTLDARDGFTLGVTPIIDGVALPEQTFAGVGAGTFVVSAPFAQRGTRCTARVRTLAAPGDFAVVELQTSYVALRATPR